MLRRLGRLLIGNRFLGGVFCRKTFTNEQMAVCCIVCTLIAVLPSCLNLFRYPRKEAFLLSLINCSLAFFLFSFQVNVAAFSRPPRFGQFRSAAPIVR